jgi:hypothetical protein
VGDLDRVLAAEDRFDLQGRRVRLPPTSASDGLVSLCGGLVVWGQGVQLEDFPRHERIIARARLPRRRSCGRPANSLWRWREWRPAGSSNSSPGYGIEGVELGENAFDVSVPPPPTRAREGRPPVLVEILHPRAGDASPCVTALWWTTGRTDDVGTGRWTIGGHEAAS